MEWLLALDATEQSCSVALANQSDQLLSRRDLLPRKHAEKLLPMVDGLLGEAGISPKEITAIAVSVGPGAFAGIRIASCVAQGLAFGWDCPVVPVSSLEAMARQAIHFAHQGLDEDTIDQRVLVVLDARLGELYTACYSYQLESILAPSLLTPQQLMSQVKTWFNSGRSAYEICVAGSGLACLPELASYVETTGSIHRSHFYLEMQADAVDVLYLGRSYFEQGKTVAPEDLRPLYLRRPVQKK